MQTGRFCYREASGWGESWETRKIPQPEATGKQAGWGKSWKIGKIPQPEAKGKQAGWGKIWEIRKLPQPEAIGKQASLGKSWKTSHKALVGFGRGEDSGAFRGSCTAFCVG